VTHMGLMTIVDGARSWRDALRASPLDIHVNGHPLADALTNHTLSLKSGMVSSTSRLPSQAEVDALHGVSELLSTIYPGIEKNLTTISTSSTMDGFLALMAEAQVDDWARGSLRERAAIAREFNEVWKGQMGYQDASWGRISGWYLDETQQLALDARTSVNLLESFRSGGPATSLQMDALEAVVHEGAHADSPFRKIVEAGRLVPRWAEEGQAVLRAEGNVHRAALHMTGLPPVESDHMDQRWSTRTLQHYYGGLGKTRDLILEPSRDAKHSMMRCPRRQRLERCTVHGRC
jgi:hypothetical protein